MSRGRARRSLARPLFAALLRLGLALPASVLAWGAEGHRLTGHMAEALLSPRARLEVARLLQGGSLAQVATEMDEQRPELARRLPRADDWHFDAQPLCQPAPKQRWCGGGHCASSRIAHYTLVLGDAKAPVAQRRQALAFVVHLLGDLHQPLHAATHGDAGGNLRRVLVRAREWKLHALWDRDLVRSLTRGRAESVAARDLLERHRAKLDGWRGATPRQVQAESHDLARRLAYGALPGFACGQSLPTQALELGPSYLEPAREAAGERLAAAGVRIADTLNRQLGGQEKRRP